MINAYFIDILNVVLFLSVVSSL